MMKTVTNMKARSQRGEKGFSLVELLVVVAILAILAAIAIPLFLNQKQKAAKATAVADGNTVAKEISSLLSANPAQTTGAITVTGTNPITVISVGGNSTGTTTIPSSPSSTFAGGSGTVAAGASPVWCVIVTNSGQTAVYNQSGYQSTATACSAAGVAS